MILKGSIDRLNNALLYLTYEGDTDFYGVDSISITVADNEGNSTGSITLLLAAVNDWPQVIAPYSLSTMTGQLLPINSIGVTDIDLVDSLSTEFVTMSIEVTYGSVVMVSTSVMWDHGHSDTPTQLLGVTGPLQAVNKALNGLVYYPKGLFSGVDEIKVYISDKGNKGAPPVGYQPGEALTASATIHVIVSDTQSIMDRVTIASANTQYSVNGHGHFNLSSMSLNGLSSCITNTPECLFTVTLECTLCQWEISSDLSSQGLVTTLNHKKLTLSGLASRAQDILSMISYNSTTSSSGNDMLSIKLYKGTQDNGVENVDDLVTSEDISVLINARAALPYINSREYKNIQADIEYLHTLVLTPMETGHVSFYGNDDGGQQYVSFYSDPIVDTSICRTNITYNSSMTIIVPSSLVLYKETNVMGNRMAVSVLSACVAIPDLLTTISTSYNSSYAHAILEITTIDLSIEVPTVPRVYEEQMSNDNTFLSSQSLDIIQSSTRVYVSIDEVLPTLTGLQQIYTGSQNTAFALSTLALDESRVMVMSDVALKIDSCHGHVTMNHHKVKVYQQELTDLFVCGSGNVVYRSTVIAPSSIMATVITSMVYIPLTDWYGVDNIQWSLCTTVSHTCSTIYNAAISITPSIASPRMYLKEDVSKIIAGYEDTVLTPFSNLHISDVDASPFIIVLNVSSGTLVLGGEYASFSNTGVSYGTYKASRSITLNSYYLGYNLTNVLHAIDYIGTQDSNYVSHGEVSVSISMIRDIHSDASGGSATASSDDTITMTIALMPVDDKPVITSTSSVYSGTIDSLLYLNSISIADIDSDILSILVWLPQGEEKVCYSSHNVDPSSGLYITNITTTIASNGSDADKYAGWEPALFMHGSIAEVNLALKHILYITTTSTGSVLSSDYMSQGMLTSCNTNTISVDDGNDVVLQYYEVLDAVTFDIMIYGSTSQLGSVTPFDNVLIVYEDAGSTSLGSIQLYNYDASLPISVTLSCSQGAILSVTNIIGDNSSAVNAVLEDAYFTTLEHYNGLVTLNISVATMDVVTRKWSDSRIMKSNLIPILPVNDAPNITIDRMNSNMTSSDDNQEQDNKVTCNSNSTCSVSIILQDVDIDEFFSPLEFDKYFKVQVSSNVTGLGVSLPSDRVGLTGIYSVSTDDENEVFEFFGNMATISNLSLSLSITNTSLPVVNEGDILYVAMTVWVSDEGCCGKTLQSDHNGSSSSIVLSIAYTYTGEPIVVDSTLSTSSNATSASSEVSTHDVLKEHIHLTYGSTIVLDRITSENRQVLQDITILTVSSSEYATSQVGLLVSCPEDHCIDGHFILPFSTAIETQVAFASSNFDETNENYGSDIQIVGSAYSVMKAFQRIEFDGFMKNNTVVSVALYSSINVLDETTLVASSEVIFTYDSSVSRALYQVRIPVLCHSLMTRLTLLL